MRNGVLLCDEPTGAIDRATGMKVLEVLTQVNGEVRAPRGSLPKTPQSVTEAAMRRDPASGTIDFIMRSLKMYGLIQAVSDLIKQGPPAFEA